MASHRPAVNGIAVVGSPVAGHGDSYLLVATNKFPMIVNIVSQSEAEAVVACEIFRNGGYSMAREVTRGSAENAAIIGIKGKRNESGIGRGTVADGQIDRLSIEVGWTI